MSRKQLDHMHEYDHHHYYQLMDQYDEMDVPRMMNHGCPSGPVPGMMRMEGVGLPGATRDENHRLVNVEAVETALVLTDQKELYQKVLVRDDGSVKITNDNVDICKGEGPPC